MNNSISYDIKNAIKTEKSLIAESILIHNKDVSLTSIQKQMRGHGSGRHCGHAQLDT
ncbi:MAG: hypothetical protein M3297_06460 [Thermoproteota archaeon]|nr:hypothetical protein [Thermoproteota archaeon]